MIVALQCLNTTNFSEIFSSHDKPSREKHFFFLGKFDFTPWSLFIMAIPMTPKTFDIQLVYRLQFVTIWMVIVTTVFFPFKVSNMILIWFVIYIFVISFPFSMTKTYWISCSLLSLFLVVMLDDFLFMNQQRTLQFINWRSIKIFRFLYKTNKKN